jgi:hypothetical protein
MRIATTQLWKEFHEFLGEAHGVDWRQLLHAYKQSAVSGRSQIHFMKNHFMDRKRTMGDREREQTHFKHNELVKDVTAGVDAIARFSEADWWSWKQGSAPFFWRWAAGKQRLSARDDMPIWICSKLPNYQQKPQAPDPLKNI